MTIIRIIMMIMIGAAGEAEEGLGRRGLRPERGRRKGLAGKGLSYNDILLLT